jgi:UDP-N-acetylglucosamine--N-acetylmuramyl-(pentapeptide) pyrophosphoryl-undecaprenol N-acetylglucosamine transferase
MNAAYSVCDLVVSRAGATTIAEIAALGIPSILIPSPNVAENHQYHNAKFLADMNAAMLVEDKDAESKLPAIIKDVLFDEEQLKPAKTECKESRQERCCRC